MSTYNCTTEINGHEEEVQNMNQTSTDTYQDERDKVYSNNCPQLSHTLDNQTENVFGHLLENIELIVGYIAGWVARILTKNIKCEICVNSLVSNGKLYFHRLIEMTNMGGLYFPSPDLFEVCLETEKNIRHYDRPHFMVKSGYMFLSTKTLSKFVGKGTFTVLNLHSVDQPATFNHRLHLIQAIIEKYINVRMHYESITAKI